MDVQSDVRHVIDVLGRNQPHNLANLSFRVIPRHPRKSLRIHILVLRQLRHIVQRRPLFL